MSVRTRMINTAVTAALALAAGGFASSAFAAHDNEEQCAGVIKAGKYDCASSRKLCHGHVSVDGDGMAWIYLPKGTCERIAGAHLVQVVDPSPMK